MKLTVCDICNQRTKEEDIRYIEIYRYTVEGNVKPVYPAKEVCAICCTDIQDEISVRIDDN